MGTAAAKPCIEVCVRNEWCKGCGICVDFCPRTVLAMKDDRAVVLHPENCVGCNKCVLYCPDFAIHVANSQEKGSWRHETLAGK